MPWRRSRILAGWLMLALLPPSAGCTSSTKGADAALRDSGWGDDGSEGGVVCPGPLCDRDGDGVPDVDEDVNDDGLLGCCMERCGAPAASQKHCILNGDGCGGYQRCVEGRCEPGRELICSDGELDPTRADTFGDGVSDGERDNFVCRRGDLSPTKLGRKAIQVIRDKARGWALGLEPDAVYEALTLATPRGKEAAAAIDLVSDELAGFVLSLPPSSDTIEQASTRLRRTLRAGFGEQSVTIMGPSSAARTHDGYALLPNQRVELRLSSPLDAGALRRRVAALILGRGEEQLGRLGAPLGSKERTYVLHMALIQRYAFQRDAKGKVLLDTHGFPKEDVGRADARQLLVSGGILALPRFERYELDARWKLEDLASDSLVARPDAPLLERCDVRALPPASRLDFVVVVDEHGDAAEGLRRGALMRKFVQRLEASREQVGRFCVVGALDPKGAQGALAGRCCGPQGSVGDRFLDQSEVEAIAGCVADPPGNAEAQPHGLAVARYTVQRLLPRAADTPGKIESRATLMLLGFGQRRDAEVVSAFAPFGQVPSGQCKLDSQVQAALETRLRPYLDTFKGLVDPQAAAMVSLIGGTCSNLCGAPVAHGWRSLAIRTGGQRVDPCGASVGAALQVILDSAVGGSWPINPERFPVASSLRVAVRGKTLPRSYKEGFGYRHHANSIGLVLLFDLDLKPTPLVLSYLHWKQSWR